MRFLFPMRRQPNFAQMEAAEKDKISHRSRALEKFVKEIFAN
ncbi:MAG: non-canonical purine NTP pyrophosphatase [Alphaproteobacteria bacterium]